MQHFLAFLFSQCSLLFFCFCTTLKFLCSLFRVILWVTPRLATLRQLQRFITSPSPSLSFFPSCARWLLHASTPPRPAVRRPLACLFACCNKISMQICFESVCNCVCVWLCVCESCVGQCVYPFGADTKRLQLCGICVDSTLFMSVAEWRRVKRWGKIKMKFIYLPFLLRVCVAGGGGAQLA